MSNWGPDAGAGNSILAAPAVLLLPGRTECRGTVSDNAAASNQEARPNGNRGAQTDIEQRIRNRVQSDAQMFHIVSKPIEEGVARHDA